MTNKRIQLSTNVDGQNVNVYPVTKSEFVEFSDGKTLNDKLNNMDGNHEHGLATPAKDGFMSKEDKAKLDGVNNYTHPSTHAATMITEDTTHRFVTDAEKTKWDNKADTTMASKTNAGLMSASDKQRIDGLNAEFKTRDDKITKNTEDIKSWNDEMINKEYQYFNGEDITIENSIVSKTTDMVIKGRTLINIHPKSIYRFNAPSSEANKYTQDKSENSVIANITEEIASWCYVDCGAINRDMFKPNSKYTIIGEFNGIESVSLMDGTATYSMTSQVAFNNNRAVVQIKSAEEINRIPNDIRIIIYCYNKKTVGTVSAKNVMILEGDWTNKPIPQYFENIKSFGQQEDKISILSSGKNLFNETKSEEGLLNVNTGEIYKTNTSCTSDYIKVEKGKSYVLNGDGELRGYYGVLFDNNKTYVSHKAYSKNTSINFEQDGYFRFSYASKINTEETPATNIIFEEGSQATTYEPYKEDKKDILIKEPLRSLDENIYDVIQESNGQVIVNRAIGQYTFTGDENIQLWPGTPTDDYCYFVIDGIFNYKRLDKAICNNLPYSSSATTGKELISLRFASDFNRIYIAISKNKLTTSNIDGLKAYFKTNLTTIIYPIAEPTVEIVENYTNIDLKTYKEKTYITSDNVIKGELSFTVPMNTAANLENNTTRLNTIEDYVDNNKDNKNKISKLEEAQLSTALNVLELQKHTAMLSNGEINEYKDHTGTFIECNNTLDSRTENMIIKGKTLINLIPLIDENTKHKLSQAGQGLGVVKEIIKKGTYKWRRSSEGNSNYYPRIEIENNLKQGTTYTIQFCIETNIPNTNKGFNISYGDAYVGKTGNTTLINIGNPTEENLSYCKYTFTTYTTVTNKLNNVLYLGFAPIGNDINGWIQISDIILLEGDWTNKEVPAYFEGIKSFGESEQEGDKYKISILSHGKNIYNGEDLYIYKPEEKWRVIDIPNIPKFELGKTYKVSYKTTESVILKIILTYENNEDAYSSSESPLVIAKGKGKVTRLRFYIEDSDYSTNKKFIITNIQIEEGTQVTPYEPYIGNKKDILLKEPLMSVGDIYNVIYENNNKIIVKENTGRLKIDGRVTPVIFSQFSTNTHIAFYISVEGENNYGLPVYPNKAFTFKGNGDTVLCDKFKISDNTVLSDISDEAVCLVNASPNYVGIKILKSRIKTGDITCNDIKEYLKENPITVYYQKAEPTIEIIDSIDINVDTYKDKTYITTDNSIKGELEFKTQNNFGAIMKNVNRCISKIFNSLNNILNIKGE